MALFLMAGLAVLFYPAVSNWYNAQFQLEAIVGYNHSIEQMTEENIHQDLELAKEYNAALTGSGIHDPFIPGGSENLPQNYTSILDLNSGIMGTIQVPKIDVDLPIYHGTTDRVLEKGVGHMEMTAFPIGGEGNHSVLTGHTGLPTATLFTGLDKLETGDSFYITIYKETLAYEVDQILVVKPSETKALVPVLGKDYVTLVTCTPYAVNSHRLLVRGVRVPYEPGMAEQAGPSAAEQIISLPPELLIPLIVVAALVLTAVILVIRRYRGKKKVKYQVKHGE